MSDHGGVAFTREELSERVAEEARRLGGASPKEVLAMIERGELPDTLAAMQFKALYRLLHG